ncbi:putative Averufin oxidase A [Seiridium cardinale]
MSTQKTWALFGATGATGSSVLRSLLRAPPAGIQLNIQVRSKAKLLAAFPVLEKEALAAGLPIRIIEGNATDCLVLDDCLEDTEVIIMCIGQNGSHKGTTLYSDAAAAVVSSLKRLRYQQRKLGTDDYRAPTIVQLRSASLNPALASQVPKIVHKLVSFCLHHSYEDLKRACSLYEAAAVEGGEEKRRLLCYIFVDPPTIHHAEGRERTGYKLIATEKQETALSYADLGEAMVEVAQRAEELCGQAVGVSATGQVKETWDVLGGYLLSGAKGRVWNGMSRWQLFLLGGMCYTGLAMGTLPGSMPR